MIKRIIAAVAALLLAAVGVFLVLRYANQADERALEGMETTQVLVAVQAIPSGTGADGLEALVSSSAVPNRFVIDGGVTDLTDLEGLVSTAPIAEGEQILRSRFATPEELRARSDFELPEEAQRLHQVTIPLASPRALGGNITAGDTVGVFISVSPEDDGDNASQDQDPSDEPQDQEDGSILEGGILGGAPDMTHLELHKVLVVDVEGSRVSAPSTSGEGTTESPEPVDSSEVASEVLLVTLALEAPEAEKLVYAAEFGTIWLSLEPETASEDGTRIVVTTVPRLLSEIRDIYE